MALIVADASVVLKWLLPDRPGEDDTVPALTLYNEIMEGRAELVQPPHWLAEVAAVMARLAPEKASGHLDDLDAMEVPVISDIKVYQIAFDLSVRLKHHLFDTLYHAVALATPGATLVTADERYFRKAKLFGQIQRL